MVLGFFLMGLLALGAIASIAVPLWRAPKQAGPLSSESNLALWRQEREEILRDAANGSLTQPERDTALAELSERAAGEIAAEGSAHSGEASLQRRPARVLALLLAAGMVVLSVALYARLGSLDALSGNVPIQAQEGAGGLGPKDPRVLAMVQALSDKLKDKPDDLEGWVLLGRSQMVLENYHEASAAYQRALALSPSDAQLMADTADAIAMAQGRSLEGRPAELVLQAVKIDPNNMKALELAGTVAFSHGDTAGAISYWSKLRQLLPAGSDDAREVDAALASLRAGSAPFPGKPPQGTPGAPAAGAQPAVAGAGPASSERATEASAIAGRVDVQPALAAKVALTDTVFVFARAPGSTGGGPRMPLAVQKFAARELPRSFTLGDADAMTPTARISGQTEIVVQARISKSGQAIPQAGDLESVPQTVKPGSQGVSIVIDQVVR